MVFKRRNAKRGRMVKKVFSKRRGGSGYVRRHTYARLPLTGMPSRKLLRLRYSMEGSINPATAGFSSAIVFKINSLYDPEAALGGHQPLGFDQWAAFYSKYVVLGAKTRCDFYSTSTTPTVANAIVGVRYENDNTIVSNLTSIIENGRVRWKRLSDVRGSSSTTTIVSKWSAKKWFGGKNKLMNEVHGAAISADPSKLCYMHIFAGPVSETTTDLSEIRVRVTIDFIALFTDQQDLIES